MALVIRLANINSPNDYTISYKTGRTPGDVTTGFISYGSTFSGGTNEVVVSGVSLNFETQYWFKITDTVTNRYSIRNIYTHENCYFPCIFISPTPTVTPTNTITPTFTPTITISPTVTPTNTQTPIYSLTPTVTPTLSITPSITISPTVTPTETPTMTPTETPTKTPTKTPTLTPTMTPTLTPSTQSYTITVQGLDEAPGDSLDLTVYCYYSKNYGSSWTELGSQKLNSSGPTTFGSFDALSGTDVWLALQVGPGTDITFGQGFGNYTGYCGQNAPYMFNVSGTQTITLNADVVSGSYDTCGLVASPTPTVTKTPSITPTYSPAPINEYEATKCSDSSVSIWRTSQMLTVGNFYTQSDPTGVPNNSLQCYEITSTTTTFSSSNVGTVYSVSSCSDSACITI